MKFRSIFFLVVALFCITNCKTKGGAAVSADDALLNKQIELPAGTVTKTYTPRPKLVSAFYGMSGKDSVILYTLKNNNKMEVRVMNLGCTVTHLIVPDKTGNPGDVVLGFNSLEGFKQNGNPFFGCIVGRYANRIGKAKFTLDSVTYKLFANNGENTLHGGKVGWNQKVWKTVEATDSTITFEYFSPDGEEGYPGNVTARAKYIITEDNQLVIDYNATTDKACPINLTNHAYFDLSAGVDNDILAHDMMINAEAYTPVDDKLIPTGKIAFVVNTPFDFAKSKPIGKDIAQVKGGYDHNFVLKGMGLAAEVYHAASGRVMAIHTTTPGVQFYTGNFLNGSLKDTKGGKVYGKHAGFCLETQHFPDSPNQPLFPSSIIRPGQTYNQKTSYAFSVR